MNLPLKLLLIEKITKNLKVHLERILWNISSKLLKKYVQGQSIAIRTSVELQEWTCQKNWRKTVKSTTYACKGDWVKNIYSNVNNIVTLKILINILIMNTGWTSELWYQNRCTWLMLLEIDQCFQIHVLIIYVLITVAWS